MSLSIQNLKVGLSTESLSSSVTITKATTQDVYLRAAYNSINETTFSESLPTRTLSVTPGNITVTVTQAEGTATAIDAVGAAATHNNSYTMPKDGAGNVYGSIALSTTGTETVRLVVENGANDIDLDFEVTNSLTITAAQLASALHSAGLDVINADTTNGIYLSSLEFQILGSSALSATSGSNTLQVVEDVPVISDISMSANGQATASVTASLLQNTVITVNS